MFPYLQKLFESTGYVPLGQCYSWQTEVLAVNLIGNIIIALTYFCTPFLVYYLTRKRNLLIHNYLFVVFSLFAILGGLRYVLEIVSIWQPVYYLLGIFKIFAGLFAVATLVILVRNLPQALGLDKARALKQVNDKLVEEGAERENAQIALRQANEALESRVQQRTGQLIKINRELEKEIEQRKKTEEDLIGKNRELTRINAELDNFVFHASHDLKDPIVKIEGLVSALKEEIPNTTPSVNEIFQHLDGSLLKVDKTMLDLTEVGRFQKPDEDKKCEELQFDQVFKDACAELEPQLTAANARIITNFQAPVIHLASQKLKRIFINLLSNALKFRKPDQVLEIDVSTEPISDYVMLRIADNGKGLNLADSGNYEDPNYFPVNEEGEGLGLPYYIVKRIVSNASGQIRIQSEPGHGSAFEILLPLETLHQE